MKKLILLVTLLFMSNIAYCNTPTEWLHPYWSDVNKYHNDGEWKLSYYSDDNNNDQWDAGEKWTHHDIQKEEDWKITSDGSCWMAATGNIVAGALKFYEPDKYAANTNLHYEMYDRMMTWGGAYDDGTGYAHPDTKRDQFYSPVMGGQPDISIVECMEAYGVYEDYSLNIYCTEQTLDWIYDEIINPIVYPSNQSIYEFVKDRIYDGSPVGLSAGGHIVTAVGWNDNVDSDDPPYLILTDSDRIDGLGIFYQYEELPEGYQGYVDSLYDHSYVIMPRPQTYVPEPSMICIGVGMLLIFRKKFKCKI